MPSERGELFLRIAPSVSEEQREHVCLREVAETTLAIAVLTMAVLTMAALVMVILTLGVLL